MNANVTSKQKIVFLGDQSTGKTSIINRFIYDTFESTERVSLKDFILYLFKEILLLLL